MLVKITLFLFFAFIFGASANVAHRYHTSLTRIDYNADEKLAEIIIQVFTHDLEDALAANRASGKQPVHLDKTPKIDEIVLGYLANRFVIKNKNGEIKKMRWVGIEPANDVTLIYVETLMPEGFDRATLENGILNDLFGDQVNLVTARAGGTKTDLVFKTNEAPQSLIKKAESRD